MANLFGTYTLSMIETNALNLQKVNGDIAMEDCVLFFLFLFFR